MSTILVVSNDKELCGRLASALGQLDGGHFTLQEAPTLAAARKWLRDQPAPKLVLADQTLPDGAGMEMLPGLGRKAQLPMILLLDDDGHELITEAMRAGAIDVLVKSAGFESAVPELIRRSLGNWTLLSERLRLRSMMHEAENMRTVSQLAGGVAHDFNNQLAVMMGFSELLMMNLKDNVQLMRYSRHIRDACRKTQKLTQQLLAYSRQGNYRAEVIDLRQVLDSVTAWLREEGVAVEQDFDLGDQSISGDPEQLEQALMAVATNARQAVVEGVGEVTISTCLKTLTADACKQLPFELVPGAYVQISIQDNGSGIDADVLRHVFEPFFTTREPGQGSGMGLAAAYGTVVNHKGAITCESEPGKGAAFHIWLPRVMDETDPFGSISTLGSHTTTNLRVLLVDDEQAVLQVAKEMLQALGCEVTCVTGGAQAIEHFRQSHGQIDLILLDMVMPCMDGATVYRELAMIDPSLRTYICSGYSMSDEIARTLRAGALGVLQKPFSLKALGSLIQGEKEHTTAISDS